MQIDKRMMSYSEHRIMLSQHKLQQQMTDKSTACQQVTTCYKWGCVEVRVQMLSESNNFWQIRNPTDSDFSRHTVTWLTLQDTIISSHLISSHLISSHLISSHLISSHLISTELDRVCHPVQCNWMSWAMWTLGQNQRFNFFVGGGGQGHQAPSSPSHRMTICVNNIKQ